MKLKSSFRKFYARDHDLVDRYGISVSQMTTDMIHLSYLQTFFNTCIVLDHMCGYNAYKKLALSTTLKRKLVDHLLKQLLQKTNFSTNDYLFVK